jgi:tRNA A-37 threonylcarbamoyl transferase component Bud32
LPLTERTNGPVLKELQFLEHLGAGVFAGVWRALDPKLNREVAVKVFLPTEVVISDALAHARALARVEHPNVVPVYEVVQARDPAGSDQVVDAVIMQLLSGGTLADALRGPMFSVEEAERLGFAILSGIEAIHGVGLAHGDLHEGNVMLDKNVGAKIIDILYRGTLATLPTTTREQHFTRDLDSVRGLLGLVLNHTNIAFEAAHAYREATLSITKFDGFKKAFRRALLSTPPSQLEVVPGLVAVDHNTAARLWRIINSVWLRDWYETRQTHPQYEESRFLNVFERYIRLPEQPEFRFRDPSLSKLHEDFVSALVEYGNRAAEEMVPANRKGRFVISTKASGRWIENYSEQYERQVQLVLSLAQAVWTAWTKYVEEINSRYPEITDDQSFPPTGHEDYAEE